MLTASALHSLSSVRSSPARKQRRLTLTQDVQIKCINKSDRFNPHERIKYVGGINADGTRWKLSLDEAVKHAKNKTYRFWTIVDGKSVWVVVARSASGNEYLKTEADGEQPNNLLSLPECP